MKILDYFIKDSHLLSEDEYYVKRLLVSIQLILVAFTLVFISLSFFGIFKTEYNLGLFFISTTVLFLYRKTSNDILPLIAVAFAGTTILYINVMNTGQIYSYNNKWFTLIMLVIVFVRPKWLLYYLILVLGLQLYFFSVTEYLPDCALSPNLKIEEFVDNIVYFLLTFTVIHVLHNYLFTKNKRLNASKQLLSTRSSELIKSNQELERFAYIASHDLKSPLRNISSFVMLLEKELGQKATDKEKEYIDFIKNGSQKLNTLVEDVLNFSKASNNLDNFELVDPNPVISDIKKMLNRELEEKNATISLLNELPKIKAKRNSLLLLFKNIIENGLKYNTSKNPTIIISSQVVKDTLEITIKDNGIGIDQKYHKTIFDMFSRLHADSQYEGSGLGLALTKKIMNEMDGQIKLKSELNLGSSFILVFPLERIVE